MRKLNCTNITSSHFWKIFDANPTEMPNRCAKSPVSISLALYQEQLIIEGINGERKCSRWATQWRIWCHYHCLRSHWCQTSSSAVPCSSFGVTPPYQVDLSPSIGCSLACVLVSSACNLAAPSSASLCTCFSYCYLNRSNLSFLCPCPSLPQADGNTLGT